MKTRSWTSRKIHLFPKWLIHGFGLKMAIFRSLIFWQNRPEKKLFYDILERIKPFLGYENKKLKQSKNWHFSKGINPWFWYQNGHFWTFFFRQNRPEKCLLRYSRTNKGLSRIWKQEVEKVEKLTFFQRALPMVLVSKWPFFETFFF